MMNLFMDSEFAGLRQDTTLISLGQVTDTGMEFYSEFTDYNRDQVAGNTWLLTNVIDNLLMNDTSDEVRVQNEGRTLWYKGNTKFVRQKMERWISRVAGDQKNCVTVWSDCLHYDWVLFREIWAPKYDIPRQISYIPMDICTLFEIKGLDPDIDREEFIGHSVEGTKHNALYDAKVIKACYDKLMTL